MHQYCIFKGKFVIERLTPDGDSIRFIADSPQLYKKLDNGHRVRPNFRDGSVQLRLEGIDAPEIHYKKFHSQPLAMQARNELLDRLGFQQIKFYSDEQTVIDAKPDHIDGFVMAKSVDKNGRPVAYLFAKKDDVDLTNGDWQTLSDNLLRKTTNYRMLESGAAYITVYTATPYDHRQIFAEASHNAKQKRLGVWEKDVTSEFYFDSRESFTTKGANSQLVLPKFYRRIMDYFSAGGRPSPRGFRQWLIQNDFDQNDRILVRDTVVVSLADLIEPSNNKVFFGSDLLECVFEPR